MAIKAVIFDFGGVVVKDVDKDLLRDIKEAFGISLPQVKTALDTLLPSFQIGECNEDTFWDLFSREVNKTIPREAKELWICTYVKKAKVNDDVMKIIAELKRNGYKVGVLSNTIPPHAAYNKAQGRYDVFDAVVLSCDPVVKLRKPNPRIYALAATRLGCSPAECVYVEDKTEYLPPARQAGMMMIHFKTAAGLRRELKKLNLL